MNTEALFYLLPYLFSLVLSATILVYSWRHRHVLGASAYCLYVGGQTLSIFAFIIEMISPELETKILWDKLQWFTQAFSTAAYLFFAARFGDVALKRPTLTWSILLAIPVLFSAVVATDGWHHLIYEEPHLNSAVPFTELEYGFGGAIGFYVLYTYSVTLLGIGLLIHRAIREYGIRRQQFLTIAIGFLIPVVLSIFILLGIRLTPQRDNTPFTFALGNLIVAIGLFRYRLFQIAPIARERVMEDMADPIIVVDTTNHVADINRAASILLGLQNTQVLGLSAEQVFTGWPFLLELLQDPYDQHREIEAHRKGERYVFDIRVSSIRNRNRQRLGRVIVARDVTRLKNLEENYRALSAELEQRVEERTQELRKSAERYRAVVEDQTEFIVRWKPDRTRTFVNEAYARFFEFSQEQALHADFMRLIHEQDRMAVTDKIARLLSGQVDSETDTHRVLLPDGHIGWQEWTDRAIRDENGQIIEIQSIGRDVTDRKQAEEQIRKLSRAVEQSNTSIMITDPLGQIEYVNPYFSELSGYSLEEVGGQNPRFLKSGLTEDAVYRDLWRTITEGQEWRGEFCNRKKDGELYWESASISPIMNANGVITHFVAVKIDITELKRAQQALRESESLYRKAIEVAGAVPYRQSYQEGEVCFIFIGEGIRDLTGYGPEEFSDHIWSSLIEQQTLVGDLTPYSWEDAIERMRSGVSSIWQCEYRILTRAGERRWIHEAAVELHSGEGRSTGSIGLFQDITERKRVEQALRDSESIYRKAIETAGAVPYRQSYSGDFQLSFDFVGEGIRELLGCSPDELTPELWDSLILESHLLDDLAQYGWTEAARRVRLGLSPFWRCEHKVKTLDGRVRWIFESAVELRNGAGIAYGSIGLFQDITGRKESEEALRTSEERLSTAFRASPTMVTISRIQDARLLEVNETFEKLSGYKREEVIGKSTMELGLWVEPGDREQLLKPILEKGGIRNQEIRFRNKHGQVLTCLVSGDRIELEGEQCILATILDISERKAAEARILRLNRLYVTISQINQTIVHARDKDSLFREICQVTTHHGQFRMAWIGLLDGQGSMRPYIHTGEELGYLKDLRINIYDEIQGRGPTGTAVREKRCIICQDIETDPRMVPWREEALKRGYRSSAAVPLREQGQVIGALTVYASEAHGFDEEDEKLLEQIGMDVSFALDSLQADLQRQAAEQNLEEAYDTTLEGWAGALDLRDKETEGHSRRVTEATLIVAKAMNISEEEAVHIRRGALLHDIGKMGIPDQILRKNGPLDADERHVVEKHPQTAFDLLKGIPYLQKALEIPYSHHEKWDGTGYPLGMKGSEIPLPARIFAVVDVWDALSSDRPYRAGWAQERVVEYIQHESGRHFDPQVVEVFLQLLREGKI